MAASKLRKLKVHALHWKTDEIQGADLYYEELVQYPTGLRRLVRLQWPLIVKDGWSRFAWTVIHTVDDLEGGLPATRLLFVIAAPDVEVIPEEPERSHAQITPAFQLNVIRVQRADFVPQPGEPICLGTVLPGDDFVFARTAPGFAQMRSVADGAVLTHSKEHWQVRITVPAHEPAAWGVSLFEAQGPKTLMQSEFEVHIVATRNVTVTASQYYDLFPVPVPLPSFLEDPDIREISQVHVRRGDTNVLFPLPRSGLDVSMGRSFQSLEATLRYPEWQQSLLTGLYVMVEVLSLVPVLGTAIDVGQFIHAASTGRNIWGEKVSNDELVLLGAFAVVGLVADAGPVLLKGIKVATRLRPGAKLVFTNPGYADALKQILRLHNAPHVVRALERIPEDDALRLLNAVEEAADDRRKIATVLRTVDEVISPLLRAMESLSDMPTPLFADVMKATHPERLSMFADFAARKQKAVIKAFTEAATRADPTVLKSVLSPEEWDEYLELVREDAIHRVFNTSLDGFRSASLDASMYRELLAQGYDVYARGKQLADARARTAIDWALQQRTTSRFYKMLVAELGPKFQDLLRPAYHRVKYAVDGTAATFYDEIVNSLDNYEDLRALVSKQGLGAIFEVDHMLEKRFLNYWHDMPIPDETFFSMVVPKNIAVADNLLARGVNTFPYVHSQKTARMRELIPYGKEGFFSPQEIYDAYRLVFEHEYGFGASFVRGALNQQFTQMMAAAKIAAREGGTAGLERRVVDAMSKPLDTTSRKSATELLASVMNAHRYFD